MKSSQMQKSVAISATLHVLFFLSFLVLDKQKTIEKSADFVEIEVQHPVVHQSPTTVPQKISHNGSSHAKTAKSLSWNSQTMKNLLATNKVDQMIDGYQQKASNTSVKHSQSFDDPRLFDFQSDQMFSEHSEWEYYRAVYEKIDSHLLFDSKLAQYNHFGTVYVQFTLSPSGHLLDQDLKVKTADRILKVHVMRALRKAVAQGLVADKINPARRSVLFQSKFDFVQDSPAFNFQKQKEFGRPVLVFKRATTEKPTANTLSDQLLDGGISYDVFAAAEKWKKYNHKKMLRETGFDPFSSYKEDPDYNL